VARYLALIPTFNEAANIGPLLDAVRAQGPEWGALVVDDDSPDGTGRIVEERAASDRRIHLLRRRTDRGRGRAGLAGFARARELGVDGVLEMDADFSHHPRHIPEFLAAAGRADIVVGSRLTPGGGERGRSFGRRAITRGASFFLRSWLGLPIRDPTSGYRFFNRRALEAIPWESLTARGPEVVQETLVVARSLGLTMTEIPILFEERRAGRSTFSARIMVRSLAFNLKLRLNRGFSPGGDRSPPWTLGESTASGQKVSAQLWLVPLSWFYGTGRTVAHGARRLGLRPTGCLPRPVFCVGNLTVGGTGKTPFLAWLAQDLVRRGLRPAILSRGYGALPPARDPRIVSTGSGPVCDVRAAGDEPFWLAQTCPGVPVVIGASRYGAGRLALRDFDPQVFLLDDGFQHDALERDLDLVLWDARDEPQRMRLVPAGRLRERLGALRRASAVLLTHLEYLPEAERASVARRVIARLKRYAPQAPIFRLVGSLRGYQRLGLTQDEGRLWRPMDELRGRRAVLLSGLARPDGFERMVKSAGVEIALHAVRSDHVPYDGAIRHDLERELKRHGTDLVLTTEKDAVKLRRVRWDGMVACAVGLELHLEEAERWRFFFEGRLCSLGLTGSAPPR